MKIHLSIMARVAIGLLVVFPLLAAGNNTSSVSVACQIKTLKQDSAETREQCLRAAKRGDAVAQDYVGVMYQFGHGVEKNKKEAIKWYKKAAEQGYPLAQFSLGMVYQDSDDARSFQEIEQNYRESAKWLTMAAEQGYAPAQQNLGSAYYSGYGVPVDIEKAMEWYKKAAEQGLITAQTALGGKYKDCGRIAKKKGETDKATECFEQAIEWYKKAEAYNSIGDTYAAMGNDVEAVKWYKKAAEQDKGGYYELGLMYAEGRGVPQSDTEALKWMMGTVKDEANALHAIGKHFLETKKDPETAAKWIKRAAEQNHQAAAVKLFIMYEDGRGVAKDRVEAAKWRKRAIELKAIELENENAK